MDGAFTELATVGLDAGDVVCVGFDAPAIELEPCSPPELRALVLGGENESDACELLLAQTARIEGALEVAIGEGLAALTVGERLISLGFSSLKDYAREILGIEERKAQGMARLARELRTRPLLRAAVCAGEVRIRGAETVLPVARGDAEAVWVERARSDTVRGLEAAVEEALGAAEDDDEAWTRLHVRLAPEERAVVDEALELAGALVPGSTRAQRFEAMAQEYLAEHPVEAGSDGAAAGGAFGDGGAFRDGRERRARAEAREAELEAETERWSYLPVAADIPAPDGSFDTATSAGEIDRRLRALAAKRDRWDAILGWAALVFEGVEAGELREASPPDRVTATSTPTPTRPRARPWPRPRPRPPPAGGINGSCVSYRSCGPPGRPTALPGIAPCESVAPDPLESLF